MTKVLVNKILLLVFMLCMMGMAKAQSISYGYAYDLSNVTHNLGPYPLSTYDAGPQDIAFNSDGTKLFILGSQSDDITQFSLATPYETFSGLTHDGEFSVGSEQVAPTGFAFNPTGTKLFVVGGGGPDVVHQYSLTTPFDITSGVSHDGTPFSVNSEESEPSGINFSNDGLKMFIVGSSGDDVNQYTLNTAFDITDGATFDGSPFSVSSEQGAPSDVEFSSDGMRMFIIGTSIDYVHQYELTTSFDVTSGVSYSGKSFYVSLQENSPNGMTFSPDGDKMYVVGSLGREINQYELNPGGFTESIYNDGTVTGSIELNISGETFTNQGGSLIHKTHYAISNLPAGLSPSLSVSGDGTMATLTVTGDATSHQDVDDIGSLVFTFVNSAFTGGNAAAVDNAVAASSNLGIDFNDNNPAITYGHAFSISNGATAIAAHSILSEEGTSTGISFSSDGLTMFVVGSLGDEVNQYSLTNPFDISSGVTHDGLLDVSTEVSSPNGITFSSDGMKMFLTGFESLARVFQYSLTTPFVVTSGVTYDNFLNISGQEGTPQGIAFNNDGSRMFIVGSNGDEVNQYDLANPFDITSGVVYNSVVFSVASEDTNPSDIKFNEDGTKMFILGLVGDDIIQYNLVSPFDLSEGVTLDGSSFSVTTEEGGPQGMAFNDDGTKLFIVGSVGDEVNQYDVNVGGFVEDGSNLGGVTGSMYISIREEEFTNQGGTLTSGADYSIANLPSGLTPSIAVAADGKSATLTLSGNATDHQDTDDIDDLQFTFGNSAFTTYSASAVDNAVSASSEIGIDFEDNPYLTYGLPYDLSIGGTYSGNSFDFSNESTSVRSITFNDDGSKMYLMAGDRNVYQYSLSTAFDLGSTITHDGSPYATGMNEPRGIEFSPDGMKMFVVDNKLEQVNQFSLTTPFDVTSGVTSDGTTSVIDQTGTNSPWGIAFNGDGSKMFISGIVDDEIYQYSLSTPYDITSTVTYDNISLSVIISTTLTFNPEGTILYVGHYQYSLETPFDISSGVSAVGAPTLTNNQNTNIYGVHFSADGKKLYLGSDFDDSVHEYLIDIGGFEETEANDGTVDGTLTVKITGDTFVNAGSTLAETTHYSIDNLPSGMVPTMTVSADGSSAELSISGKASAHQNSNDVAGLIFTFEDAAFNISSAVVNSESADSESAINFNENYPAIFYGYQFDPSNASIEGSPFSVSGDELYPSALVFNPDGTKVYIIGSEGDDINQYSLSTPFDITSGVTLDGASSSTTTQDDTPSGMAFSADGSKVFLTGTSSDAVYQYSLTTPWDVTTGFSYSGSSLDVSTYETIPYDVKFNNDGTKMFVVGASSDAVHQYSLTTPFDIGSGVSYVANVSVVAEDSGPAGMAFNADGTQLAIVGSSGDEVNLYRLSAAFDISGGMTVVGAPFSISSQETGPTGIAFSANGDKMFIVGTQGKDITQFDLNSGGFTETSENFGDIEGSLVIRLFDDLFTNASGTLTHGGDYTINNLPVGFTPTLTVAADGLTATLTLSGSTTAHQDTDDVDFEFTFANSAFVLGDASNVDNAIAADAGVGIDFTENNPVLTYGSNDDLFNVIASSTYDISGDVITATGIAFNPTGTKMFISGPSGDEMHQYSLTTPFDVSSGVTNDGSPFDLSNEDSSPRGIAFSNDGMKMFVVGQADREINQYSLTSSFDITSGVSFDGSLSVAAVEFNPVGITFNNDGTKMYMVGFSGDDVNQYDLTTPFVVTSGASYEQSFDLSNEELSPYGIVFNSDGTQMFIVGITAPDEINQYNLSTPFDVSTAVYDGFPFTNVVADPRGIAISADDQRFFVVGGNGTNDVNQYDRNPGGFTETSANDGSVEGQLSVRLAEDMFTNAGGTMTHGADYTINNLPSGLTPTLTVAGDAFSAILELSSNASSHINADDIAGLEFTFANSAFNLGDASNVANAIAANSGFGVDFIEAPSISDQDFSVAENSANATSVGTVIATDNDGEDVTFSITAGNDLGGFAIHSTSGEITVADVNQLDFETNPTFTLTVQASDGSLTSSATITIDLTNVAEAPTDWSLDNSSIVENNVVGDVVGQITTTDVDAGETYTYTLVTGTGDTDNGAFTIDGDELKAAEVFDFETKNSYSIRIQTDDGNSGVFAKSVTISITNEAEAPTDISLDVTSIAENNSISDVIGTFTTDDEDTGETHLYSLVAGTGDEDNDSFTIVGDELQAGEVFNFELKNSYSIRVETDDQNGNTMEKEFSITISDESEAPTNIILTGTAVDENNAISYLVSSLSTEDEDDGETYVYTLVAGAGDDDNASFSLASNQLRAAEVFDFETQSSYSVRIQTDDQNGGVFADSYTITINDVNDNPTDVLIASDNVNENLPIGSAVGTLSTEDEDTGDVHTYSLKAGNTDNDSFTISGDQLLTGEVFDYETKDTYNLEIITNDGNGGTFEQEIAIMINDANDDPSDIDLSSNTVAENASINTVVGTLSSTDQDSGDSFTYTLVAGTGDTGNSSFNINGTELRTSASFNFEGQNSYSIRLETSDGNGGSFEEIFTITVTDETDAPTDISLSGSSIQENNSINDVIGTLSSVDEDAAESHSYTLVAGTGDTNNSSFNINGNQLRASETFDFETKSAYSVRVETNDGNGGLFEKTFLISVTNQNEVPTDIQLTSNTIDESSPSGTTVGSLSTIDEDNGETYTYTLVSGTGDTDNSSFTIVGTQLRSAEVFDFETKTSYSIRIETNDGNGGTYAEAFTIDINDLPPGLTGVAITNDAIDENLSSGSTVGSLFALGDEIDGVPFTFTLASGAGDTDNGSFSISGANLLSSISFNHEIKDQYAIRVMADDGEGSTVEQAMTIQINDVNEDPTNILISNNNIDENEPIGTAFGTITSTDEDDTFNHTYSLVSGAGDDDNDLVSISGDQLLSAVIFNHEAQSTLKIRVRADDGLGGIRDEEWTLQVNDVSEDPTDLSLSVNAINENNAVNEAVGTLSTTDEDAGETYTYFVVATLENNDWESFDISGDQLIATEVLDFETKSSYSIEIETRDNNGGIYSEEFVITVNDVNENPSDILLSSDNIDESTSIGALIGAFSTIDEDAGQSHTYTLVSGSGDTDNASFTISGDELLSNEVFDFETRNTYSIRVQTNDGNGGSYAEVFSIFVNDLPSTITAFTLGNDVIDENLSSGAFVGTLSTSGEDLSGSFTYTLVSGTGDSDNSSFSISGDQLLTAESFNFENKDSYSIRVMTNDGSLSAEETFTITVNDVFEAPTDILLSANNIDENNAIGDVIGSLSSVDEDAGESFTYSLVSGTGDTDNASFTISGDLLLANVLFDFEGQDSYAVRIETNDGNGGTFEESFTISINDLNEGIAVVNPVADQMLEEGFGASDIDVSSVFQDEDGDVLTYTVESSDDNVVSVSNSGSDLTITEVGLGTATITVTADDGAGNTIFDEFEVSVTEVNEVPVVANAIADQNEDEGFASVELDLTSTFSDADGDNLTLSASSDDETVVTVSINGSILTIAEAGIGTATITVTANDGRGGSVSDTFTFEVIDIPNNAPVVANAIADQSQDEGFASAELDLTNTFSDADGDNLALSASSDDETVVTVSINGSILTVTEAGIGSANITVTANDGNGGSVSDTFTFEVAEVVNNAPVVANAIADQNEDEGFASVELDLTNTFSDADGDNLTLSASSDDETVVTVSINGSILTVTEAGIGSANITVTANDGNGGSVSDTFTFDVVDIPNNAPVVANPIADAGAEEGFGSAQISYAGVFTDADGDDLTVTVTSSDETVVTVEVIANDQIQVTEVGLGTSTITVTANDGNGGTVADTFTFEVTEAALGLEDEINLKVYPNPVMESLNIESDQEVSAQLSDLNGRELQRATGRSIKMDVDELSKGVYLITITKGNETIKKRIIKAN